MDLWEKRSIKPMLIGKEGEPFDDPDWIYELKLDGERCIAYLDPKEGTELRNKRNLPMLPKLPELSDLHRLVKERCILDGELIVMKDGFPDFAEIQRRSIMSNSFKIQLAASKYPACYTVYDILYRKDQLLTSMPLLERKEQLGQVINQETDRLAISRVLDGKGQDLFALTRKYDLEGVVAKRKQSRYFFDKRTIEWIKIKNMQDDDFIVCGYIHKEKGIISLVLGQYRDRKLVYKGHVTMGISRDDFSLIQAQPEIGEPLFQELPSGGGNDRAIWIRPDLVCSVKYMHLTPSGGMRHAVFKGLRLDKQPEDCKEMSRMN